jgi:hypothetical protein
MKRALLFLFAGLILLVAATAFAWPDLSLFLASDSCLATGGSFDFSQLRCDFRQGHTYVTFDLWPFWVALVGDCLGIALVSRGVFRLRPGDSSRSKPLRGSA